MYFKKMLVLVILLGVIPVLIAGCMITRAFEPKFEVVSMSISPEPLQRQVLKDPDTLQLVQVCPLTVLTLENLRTVPCRLTDYIIEYSFASFASPPESEYEGKNEKEINKDLLKWNKNGKLTCYLKGCEEEKGGGSEEEGEEEEKNTVTLVVAAGDLYTYMENPNFDAAEPPDVDDDPDILINAKITYTGVDKYGKFIETEGGVTINTEILAKYLED